MGKGLWIPALVAMALGMGSRTWGQNDPGPREELPPPTECAYSEVTEIEQKDDPVFEEPLKGPLVDGEISCAPNEDRTFNDVREKVIFPDPDGKNKDLYGLFKCMTFILPDSKTGTVRSPSKKIGGAVPCPECKKNTLHTWEVYPWYPVPKEQWDNSPYYIQMAYWKEYEGNKNLSVNPEARIGWEAHYDYVLKHENKHEKHYLDYLKVVKTDLKTYSEKIIVLKMCAQNVTSINKKRIELGNTALTKRYATLKASVEKAKSDFDEADNELDKKDKGKVEELVPGTIPLIAPPLVVLPLSPEVKRWEESVTDEALIKRKTGYTFYQDRNTFSAQWSLIGDGKPDWLSIDEKTGIVTIHPQSDTVADYKEDKEFLNGLI